MKNYYGFTLVELLIVVAIIGILASVALPAYNDYVVRSRVTEVVTGAQAAKVGIHVDMLTTGNRSSLLNARTYQQDYQAPLTDLFNSSQWIDNIIIDNATGIISLTVANHPSMDAIRNTVVRWVPNRRGTVITWQCQTTAAVADYELLPLECRNNVALPIDL